ncbi:MULTISPECIES: phage holin [Pseudobutyrivibrio]|uniref:phage holin n=1 Tax=Pseudobutyrivibrio TaxID=46205 RepID=UPI000B89B8DD|nr:MULTISPECIES: phage holin [Pseudobutyrivibrio]
MKNYLRRLKNPATLIGICGYVLTILSTLGFSVDNQAIMTILESICAICVLLGIMNNPETEGIDFPKSE